MPAAENSGSAGGAGVPEKGRETALAITRGLGHNPLLGG